MAAPRSLASWAGRELKGLVKTPKLHFPDSGLLAALRGLSPDRIQADRMAYGAILETFVLAELMKLASSSDEPFEFFHFLGRYDNEVDIAIEDSRGHVVGIEVKAAATVTPSDFADLRRLSEACGKRFILGLVLYDHESIVPFGEQLYAAPVSSLWR